MEGQRIVMGGQMPPWRPLATPLPGQPIARLTPLGWTCIGPVRTSKQITFNTNFAHTYFSAGKTDMANIATKVLGS